VTVGQTLKQHGLFLVGLDVIGDYLTEVNVTSPTGMVEIAAQSATWALPCDPAMVMIQTLEKLTP
jgi:glutathione synthase